MYTEYNTQETTEIMKGIDVQIVSIKKYRGRNTSHKAIMNDLMRLPDKGKILVLIDKHMWHCWVLPCIFGATETINWDRAYATGHFSAKHEVNHLFGWKDIL